MVIVPNRSGSCGDFPTDKGVCLMERYEVVMRDKTNGNRWSMMFSADDFGHAEEQANDAALHMKDEEIVEIKKDYDAQIHG